MFWWQQWNWPVGIPCSLLSWQDFVCECFCFGSEAMNASGEAVRGLVKSQVKFHSQLRHS